MECTVPTGYRLRVQWKLDATTNTDSLEVTFADRTKWVVGAFARPQEALPNDFRPIRELRDPVGNALRFAYVQYSVPSGYTTLSALLSRLTTISDSANSPLLTLGYDADGFVAKAHDRFDRYVYYHTSAFLVNAPPPTGRARFRELDAVSMVADGDVGAPVRYDLGYVQSLLVHYGNKAPYLGSITVPSPTGTGTQTATIAYNDANGTVKHTIDANGNKHEYHSTDWDGAPNPAITTVKVKNPAGTLVHQYTYGLDSTMGWTFLKNAVGQTVVTRTYGGGGSPYKPISVTDGNGRTWTYTYDGFGNQLTATSPKGTVTTSTYDYAPFPLGRLTGVKEGTKSPTYLTYHEPAGLVHEVVTPVPGQSGSAATQTTTYTYSALGNLTQVTTPGNNAAASRSTYFGYTTDRSYSQAEALGQPIKVTDALGKVSHLRYDARGNLVASWDALGNTGYVDYNLVDQPVATFLPPTGNTGTGSASTVNTYLYLGGPLTKTEAKNEAGTTARTTNLTYGPEGETLARTGSAESVALTYDAAYRTKTLKDGNNNATVYGYDTSGRPTEIAYPLATGANVDRVRFTGYDAVGNLLSRTDGNGQVTNYTYGDADGGLTAVAYPGATAHNVALAYDAYGRPASVANANATLAYAYDDLDGLTSETTTYAGLAALSVAYAYHPDGSRASVTLPGSRVYAYGYDANGRCTSFTMPQGGGTATFAYLDNGWQSSRTLPNGLATTYAYNAVGALTGLQNAVGTTAVSGYGGMGYDGVFNLTGLTAAVPSAPTHGGATAYAYDAKDRLTGETSARLGGYGHTNAYDAAGNPTTLRNAAQTFDADNRRTGFAYDGNGAQLSQGGKALAFDPESRLVSRGTNWTAGYRPDGLRAWREPSGNRKRYLYVDGQPWAEVSASGTLEALNAYAPDGLVGRYWAGAWDRYAFDPQGSVGQVTDPSGAVIGGQAYDAYGKQATSWGSRADTFGFNAQWARGNKLGEDRWRLR